MATGWVMLLGGDLSGHQMRCVSESEQISHTGLALEPLAMMSNTTLLKRLSLYSWLVGLLERWSLYSWLVGLLGGGGSVLVFKHV